MSDEVDIVAEMEAVSACYDEWVKRMNLYIAARDRIFDRLTSGEINRHEYLRLSKKIGERERALAADMARVRKDLENRVQPALREMIKEAELESAKTRTHKGNKS